MGGLTEAEAALRLRREGPNELPGQRRRSPIRILAEVLREPMFALLTAAAAIYLALGDWHEAVLLAVFAMTSVSIAVIQEARTERVLDTLSDLTSPRALVIRSGGERRIPGREVVRGDLLVLAEGDRVPADARVLSAHDLEADESLLTGEPFPVRKDASAPAPEHDAAYVYSGSLVVRGHGTGRVTATGAQSEIGKIGVALAGIDPEPPRLRVQTRALVIRFAVVSLGISILAVILYGLWRGSWLDAVLNGIALSMSMLPEEFPLVLTVFMVMGAWRISRARVLTRRIAAIETLGAATVLCTDKTGTLTQNRMAIAEIRAGNACWRPQSGVPAPKAIAEIISYGILASAVTPFDPMEKAFHALGAATGLMPSVGNETARSLKWEWGIAPGLLAVTQVWDDPASGRLIVASKGAPEAIAELCGMSSAEQRSLDAGVRDMASGGMRVLGVTRASAPHDTLRPGSPRAFSFTFLGLVGLADPLRPEVPAAVRECRAAGIKVVMITGDYPTTALAIAAEAGLEPGAALTGGDLDRLGEAELRKRIRQVSVFARIMPEQKLRIVDTLKANGEIVAMTGDGVNDAPSLKAAHIGIAMGGRGTDVAREAASLVLLDDDFGSIVAVVRLGRRIYNNMRKSMAYILAVHVPIAGLAVLPLVLGWPLIFSPVHIAFLEMVIDPVCSIVFEAEEAEPTVMRRPPRNPDEKLVTAGMVAWSLLQGTLVLVLVAAVFGIALQKEVVAADARALTFTTLIATNAGLVLVNRSAGSSLLAIFHGSNRVLWWVLGITGGILAAILSISPVRELFAFGPLHGDDLGVVAACGLGALIFLDIVKRFFPDARRLKLNR
ncbi:MAG TPA: cation-translocating P-type ATPase [Stellaceae bacterium]